MRVRDLCHLPPMRASQAYYCPVVLKTGIYHSSSFLSPSLYYKPSRTSLLFLPPWGSIQESRLFTQVVYNIIMKKTLLLHSCLRMPFSEEVCWWCAMGNELIRSLANLGFNSAWLQMVSMIMGGFSKSEPNQLTPVMGIRDSVSHK